MASFNLRTFMYTARLHICDVCERGRIRYVYTIVYVYSALLKGRGVLCLAGPPSPRITRELVLGRLSRQQSVASQV